MTSVSKIRLNKFISNSGICNRRQADEYISQGRVSVNDKVVDKLGFKVNLTDKVKFDGKCVSPVKMLYIILNKPKGFHCIAPKTNSKTIFSLLSSIEDKSVKSVDFLREQHKGIIVISNDNQFSNKIKIKKNSTIQIFHLKLDKIFLEKDLKSIKVFNFNDKLRIKSINHVDGAKKNELGIEIFMDSIKDLENLFLEFNYKIISCDRVLFSGLTKKDLSRGQWRNLTKQEIINLQSF